MPSKPSVRSFRDVDDEDLREMLDSQQENPETLLALMKEASERDYNADSISPVLDRFLERALDALLKDYKETFDLFFAGSALEHFVNDATKYLDTLKATTESGAVDENDDEDDDDNEIEDSEAPRRGSSPMPAMRFPVSDYYADHILEGITLSNKGGWWSAVLLIRDPKTKKPFLALYRWEQKDGTWKNRKSFVIRDQSGVTKVIAALNELKSRLPAS